MNRAYADVVFERVTREMSAAPPRKVKPVATEQGYFVRAALREQCEYFLARAAKREPRT